MHLDLNLTKNLVLHYIEENMVKDDKLITVELWFSFFGESGQAYITMERIHEDIPSYAMTEISSELSDSFNDLLEDDDIFEVIKTKCLEYEEQWNKEWAE